MWSKNISLIFLLSCCILGNAQNAAHFIRTGNGYLEDGRTAKAMKEFNRAVELEPNAESYSARARASFLANDLDHFILDVTAALKTDSLHTQANYQRALYAFRAREWKLAEKHCTIAFDQGPKGGLLGKIMIMRGEARAEIANYVQAMADLEKGIDLVDEDLEAEIILASVYSRLGEHEKAVKMLRQLTTKLPDMTDHWVNLGFELAALGSHDEALLAYEKALDLDKDEPITLSNKAYSLFKLERLEEAMKCVERSIRFQRANPYALRTRALLYLRKGDREKACEDLFTARLVGDLNEVNKLILENCSGMGR